VRPASTSAGCNCVTLDSLSSDASRGSRSRVPSRRTFDRATGSNPGSRSRSCVQQRPVAIASAIPSRKPPIVVSGVLKSP
jgi:hypothetical protein